MNKDAKLAHEIHELLRTRYSPRAFADRPVPAEALRSLFEAARWAPSSRNEQPWRFLVAPRDDQESFDRLAALLDPGNQRWAPRAPVLVIAATHTRFDETGKPNRHAWHDVGLAVAQLTAQASAAGLAVHQMGGFDREAARQALELPDDVEPVTAIAIGYPGDPDTLEGELRTQEKAPRDRHPQQAWVFGGRYGTALRLPGEQEPEQVLQFWFGELDEQGLASDETAKRWWQKDPDFDRRVREGFGDLRRGLCAGAYADWLRSARGRLAAIIVLDQLSRNMYRDTPKMFAADAAALNLAVDGIELGMDRALPVDMRAFCYLPLMHSERLADQDRCVELFERLHDELEGEAKQRIANNLKFAHRHREIVARFGRFPHRNAILDRDSTEEEIRFLEEPGSSF